MDYQDTDADGQDTDVVVGGIPRVDSNLDCPTLMDFQEDLDHMEADMGVDYLV